MKKRIFFTFLALLPSATVFAEEMVVNLTSGNAVVIQYTGAIQGVTMKGATDSIAGISMPEAVPSSHPANQQVQGKTQTALSSEKDAGTIKETGGIRFKWAEPKGED